MNKFINCKVCGKQLIGKQTMYCGNTCKNKIHQCYQAQKERGLKRKLEIIKLFGSKCSICGYKKNLAALTFHHQNSKDKKFKLDMRALSNRTLLRIKTELKKCLLVCNNCHAELHHPQHNLDSYL